VPAPSSERTERLLRELPDVKLLGLLHGASNYTFLTRLGHMRLQACAPSTSRPEASRRCGTSRPGTLYQREVAAYELSKVLGWPRIPPTVVRQTAPHGAGAMQLFIDADGRHFLGEHKALHETWVRVALFDVITNNADRKSGHCLFDAEDHVWVIDHGLTFNVDDKLRTVIWDFSGDRLPPDLCGDVERALVELERGPLAPTIEGLLSRGEVRVLKRRLRGVLDPKWRFPEPTSAWSIPWPPV